MFKNTGKVEKEIENEVTLNHLRYAAWSIWLDQGQLTTKEMVEWANNRTGNDFTPRQMRGFRERTVAVFESLTPDLVHKTIEGFKTESKAMKSPLLHPNGRKNVNGLGGTLMNDEALDERLAGEAGASNLANEYEINPQTGEGEFTLDFTDDMLEKLHLRNALSNGEYRDEDGEVILSDENAKQMVEIYGEPNYSDVPDGPDEILSLLGLSSDEWKVGNIGLTKGPAWVRDYPNENAYTRSVTRVKGTLVPFKLIDKLVISQAPPMEVVVRKSEVNTEPVVKNKGKKKGKYQVFITPDPQIGFRRIPGSGQVVTSHCEKAINVASQITRMVNPELKINNGDYLDLPEMGRWSQEAGMALVTQASINRGAQIARELDLDVILEGNHDQRLLKLLMENSMSLFGIHPAQLLDDEEPQKPSISISQLLRLDEMDCIFVEGYPSNSYRVNDSRFLVIHGDIINSNGSTAARLLNKEKSNDCFSYGHIHNAEYHATSGGRDERSAVTRWAASAGTLSRTDGGTPSMKGSFKSDGSISRTYENWQNGCAVVTLDHDDPDFTPIWEQIHIVDGVGYFRGEEVIWNEEEVREDLRWLSEHGMNNVDIGNGTII